MKPEPPDPEANALPTELSQHSVTSLNLHGFCKVMLYWFLEMNKVKHVKWCMEQTKLTSEISCPADLLHCSVGWALVSGSGGPGCNPHWWQFLTIFFCSSPCKDLSDNLTETPIVKNSIVLKQWFGLVLGISYFLVLQSSPKYDGNDG